MSVNKRKKFHKILPSVAQYYTTKIEKYGPTPKGVDWNSLESQELRFEQLLKLCINDNNFSINDYGCGYGSLADFIKKKEIVFQYHGFDISKQMILKARELHKGIDYFIFSNNESSLKVADYSIASGIFNVKLDNCNKDWKNYILYTLKKIGDLSKKGFAFNMLTKYSDKDRMRSDLYYGDPLFFFDFCKKKFSRFVSLLHDYPLYEFTMVVIKKI